MERPCRGDFVQPLACRLHHGRSQEKTLEIIAEAETYERGFYTGVMGYFDGQDLDSAVMIRFMEQVSPRSFIFKSGGESPLKVR